MLRYLSWLVTEHPLHRYTVIEANAEAAAWVRMGEQDNVVTIAVRHGRIHRIFGVLNPDKLGHVGPGAAGV